MKSIISPGILAEIGMILFDSSGSMMGSYLRVASEDIVIDIGHGVDRLCTATIS